MTPYVVFNVQTGEVLRWGTCQPDMAGRQALTSDECAIEAVIDPKNEYVDPRTKTVTPLKDMNPSQADGKFSGLPVPCTVTVEGKTYVVGDGVAEFDFNLPGTYEILVRAAGYRDLRLTVTI